MDETPLPHDPGRPEHAEAESKAFELHELGEKLDVELGPEHADPDLWEHRCEIDPERERQDPSEQEKQEKQDLLDRLDVELGTGLPWRR